MSPYNDIPDPHKTQVVRDAAVCCACRKPFSRHRKRGDLILICNRTLTNQTTVQETAYRCRQCSAKESFNAATRTQLALPF